MILGVFISLLLSACSFAGDKKQGNPDVKIDKNKEITTIKQIAYDKLSNLTLEEKVAQLFIITPEYLVNIDSNITQAGEITKTAFNKKPVGGLIYMGDNIVSPEQTKLMLKNMRNISFNRIGLQPFLCVDEEGGVVARVADNDKFSVKRFERMSIIGSRGNKEEAFAVGNSIGAYLADLGFNVDFAPVADILTNSDNTVVRGRAFGSDAKSVSPMAAGVAKGLRANDILSCYKHFPGHGDTSADTHEGYAFSNVSKNELMAREVVPFIEAIKNNEPFIMVGHISFPNILGNNTPASLSKVIITDILRDELGYKGLIITDALNMGAIRNQYSSTEACIKAIESGVDMLLMPQDFNAAYIGVLDAVKSGKISEKRLNESVIRILITKMELAQKRDSI